MDYDDFDDGNPEFSELEINPMMLLDSILGNALYGRLTLDDVYTASQMASDAIAEDGFIDEFDDLFKFETAIDSSIWLRQTVNKFYGRGFDPENVELMEKGIEDNEEN